MRSVGRERNRFNGTMNVISSYWQDFVALFFPELCASCHESLLKNESQLCLNCLHELPKTYFWQDPENAVARQLYGRLPLKQAHAFLYFQKGNKVQRLLHELKYNNKPDLAFYLGQLYAEVFKVENQNPIDLIIPVPLHRSKLKSRGYNQSEYFAMGLAE